MRRQRSLMGNVALVNDCPPASMLSGLLCGMSAYSNKALDLPVWYTCHDVVRAIHCPWGARQLVWSPVGSRRAVIRSDLKPASRLAFTTVLLFLPFAEESANIFVDGL